MFQSEKLKTVYKSRFNHAPVVGKKNIIYIEDLWLLPLFFFVIVFSISTLLLFQINLSIFPKPPAPWFINGTPDFINSTGLVHLYEWFKILTHSILPNFFIQDVLNYRHMGAWLDDRGYLHIIIIRFLLAVGAGLVAATWLIFNRLNNPVPSEITIHKRGMRVLTGMEAVKEYIADTAKELVRSGKFGLLSALAGMEIYLSTKRVVEHHIGIGASGSGKSQFLIMSIKKALEMGVKSVILDQKFEFTMAFYDENNPAHAILDETDLRSHSWDWQSDINTISKMRRFASSYIPPGEGDSAMWSNSARLQFVGSMYYLFKNVKDYTAKDLADMMTLLSPDEQYFIMKNYFPPALETIGAINEQGKIEGNVTSYGVKMNLIGYIDGLTDLARFSNPNKKKISLFKFMTDPDYPIKVLFIKPNDDERLMSSGMIRAQLNFMISLLDTPHIKESKKINGIFFLDEFHGPGRLATEEGKPTINKLFDRGRSKGWGGFLFVQDLTQITTEYSENDWKQWRAVTSSFVLTGTAPGETANAVSESIGKEYFDKFHTSYGFDSQGKRRMGDVQIQEHEQASILPTELSAYLAPTSEGNIRFLYMGRGLKNAYIFETPIVDIGTKSEAWIEQPEDTSYDNKQSRVVKLVRSQMAMSQEETVATPEPFAAHEDPDMITVDVAEARERISADAKYHMDMDNWKDEKRIPRKSREELLKAGREIMEDLKNYK